MWDALEVFHDDNLVTRRTRPAIQPGAGVNGEVDADRSAEHLRGPFPQARRLVGIALPRTDLVPGDKPARLMLSDCGSYPGLPREVGYVGCRVPVRVSISVIWLSVADTGSTS